MAVKKWLIEQEPGLADEIFLDLDPHTGIQPGQRWKEALQQASSRCEAVICLLSADWERSHECTTEFRYAETLNKTILCGRLEPLPDTGITSEWQRCDLFVEDGPVTEIHVDTGPCVRLATEGLQRLLAALRALGIGAEFFPWPPHDDPDRAPYRGWAALQEADAAVFFGRDAQIVRGLDQLRRMRTSGVESLFVILGPSGSGKSSFLRAGLLPRLHRDDRRFIPLDVVRPERAVLTGELGLAHAVHSLRVRLGLHKPPLGEIKNVCHPQGVPQLHGWLEEARDAARARLLDVPTDQPSPTLVLPLDQAEELFNADAGPKAPQFLQILAGLLGHEAGITPALLVAVTIRADRYEPLQLASELADVQSTVFDELRPLPAAQFTEVITGPAKRASAAGRRLTVEPALVDRLLADSSEGADALPLLALTLERLYCDYGDDGDLTVAEYEAMGGMAQVVQTQVDELLAGDPEQRQAQLDILHDAFIPWLATINPDNDQPMRRLAHYEDLPAASHDLINALIDDKRLLAKGTRNGRVIVEVALESLLRQWRELAAWLREEAHDLKDADALERAAADWQASDRDPAWLLEGTRLQEAESLTAKTGFRERLEPTRDYLQASRSRENQRAEAEKQRQRAELQAARDKQETAERYAAGLRKRSRVLISVLAVTVVIAVAAVISGVLAVKNQRNATAERLVAQGMSMIADQQSGGEVRGIQQLLAGKALQPSSAETALPDAVVQRRAVVKILQVSPSSAAGTGVESVAISPDGRRIASGIDRSRVQLWDAITGRQLTELVVADAHPAWGVAFSPNGKWLATASAEGAVQLWDANSGDKFGEPMAHGEPVRSLAFSGDSRWLVTGCEHGAVRIWDVPTRKEDPPLAGHTAGKIVRSVSFDSTGDRIVSGGDDKTVRLWDAHSGQPIGPPAQADAQVLSVAFSPQGDRIVTGRYDGTIQVLDGRTLQPLGDAFAAHTDAVNSVAFSPDGARIVSGSSDNTIKVWNAQTHAVIGTLTGHQGQVSGVVFSGDGTRIVSGSADGSVRVWDVVAGLAIPTGQGLVRAVAFSNDGRQMASGGDDGTVRLWDARTARPIGQPLGEPSTGTTRAINSVMFSPDSSRLVSAAKDGSIRLWDLTTRQYTLLSMLPVAGQPPPDGDLAGQRTSVQSVAFSPNGSWIVAGGNDGAVRLWDAHGKPITAVPAGYPIWSVAFSPTNRQVVTGEGSYRNRLQLWDVPSLNRSTPEMIGHNGWLLYTVVFSPDGQRVASGSNDGTVRVWNDTTGKPVSPPLSGDRNSVRSVAYSHNGRWIAAGGTDSTLRLWDTGNYQQVGSPLAGHQASVQSVTFSPDDKWILSGSKDGTMRLWPAPTDFAQELCSKITTNMSHKQWQQWVSSSLFIRYIKMCDLPMALDQ